MALYSIFIKESVLLVSAWHMRSGAEVSTCGAIEDLKKVQNWIT